MSEAAINGVAGYCDPASDKGKSSYKMKFQVNAGGDLPKNTGGRTTPRHRGDDLPRCFMRYTVTNRPCPEPLLNRSSLSKSVMNREASLSKSAINKGVFSLQVCHEQGSFSLQVCHKQGGFSLQVCHEQGSLLDSE